jgi:metal-responsive CopG/Arc/MetJ family transcriptional regulator
MKTVKIKSELWKRVEEHANKAGYSSPEEFVEHVLERELSRAEKESDGEEVERRLKGLGYLE